MLPEIFFYGLGALYTAVLNTRGVYGPPAWASVLNNVVTIVTVGVFALLPGPDVLTEKSITTTQILVLGIGTTLGIVAQALVLIPYMRRSGFRWRWRFRASSVETVPMSEVRTLAGWVLGYVAFSQIGVYVINRVAIQYKGGVSTFTYGDLLFQMPYGIIAVSLLTALMPRMSRSAARNDSAGVVADLSLGSRLSAVGLVPITGFLMVLAPTMVTVIFSYGRSDTTDSRNVGVLLALGAFGLLPFAIVMLQLRVFYALRDTRTPTLINAFMVGTKVLLVLVFAAVLHGDRVVIWLEFVTSSSYLIGAIVGQILLTRRFGRLGFAEVARTIGRIGAVTAVGSLVALGIVLVLQPVVGRGPGGSTHHARGRDRRRRRGAGRPAAGRAHQRGRADDGLVPPPPLLTLAAFGQPTPYVSVGDQKRGDRGSSAAASAQAITAGTSRKSTPALPANGPSTSAPRRSSEAAPRRLPRAAWVRPTASWAMPRQAPDPVPRWSSRRPRTPRGRGTADRRPATPGPRGRSPADCAGHPPARARPRSRRAAEVVPVRRVDARCERGHRRRGRADQGRSSAVHVSILRARATCERATAYEPPRRDSAGIAAPIDSFHRQQGSILEART